MFGPSRKNRFGIAGDHRAPVGARAAVPALGQRAPLAVADPLGDRHVEDVEAGAEDDRVDLALGPVGAHDRAPADLGDPVGDDLDVRPPSDGQVVVRDQDALAAGQVVGRELRAQLGVADRAAQVRLADQAQQRCQRDPQHRDRDRLAGPVDRRADQPLERREAPVGGALEAGQAPVAARHDPRRGALEEVELRDRRLDLGHELDRARARADHRDALALEVVVVIPGGGVKEGPLEVGEAGDVGQLRLVQRARRRRSARGRSAGRSTSPGASAPPRRPSARSRPRSRSARARAAPRRRRRGAGSRGSRAGRRRSSSSPGWARTRTSRRGSGRRSDSPDTCSRARCRRPRGRAPGSRSRRAPSVAAARPSRGR